MSSPSLVEPVTTAGPRAIGVLNVLVGGFLLAFGIGLLLLLYTSLRDHNPIALDPSSTEYVMQVLRDTTLKRLELEESQASDTARKTSLQQAHDDLASKTGKIADELDFAKINPGLGWLGRYLWLDILTAPILNAMLFLSGTGLLFCKEWARRFALFIATGKILRLGLLALLLLFVVVPGLSDTFHAFEKSSVLESLIRLQTSELNAKWNVSANLNLNEFVEILISMGYMFAIGGFCLGIIYPVVTLIVLTRPSARAACLATSFNRS